MQHAVVTLEIQTALRAQSFWGDGAIGVLKSCEKRPVTLAQLESMVSEIEVELQNRMDREVPSAVIGELVMEKLKKIDQVAYVRFASVYRQFKDINTFMSELNKLLSEK